MGQGFDPRTGMPKFTGPDLSDDEEDEQILNAMYTDNWGKVKPLPLETINNTINTINTDTNTKMNSVFSLDRGIVERGMNMRNVAFDPTLDLSDED